jgi:hypothetical protein
MQSTQTMSFASTISGNAFNPIIISDDDHSEITDAQAPFFSGFGTTSNFSSDGSSTSNSSTTSTTMMQHPRHMSFDTITTLGYAYNPIIISDDDDEDDYSVRLFLSVFAGTKELSGLAAQESTVSELAREMMGCS